MKKKFISFILLLMTVLSLSYSDVFAGERDKTIIINMNRTNLNYMNSIPFLKDELSNRGYIGLMNIRGDGGNDDKRAYASLGAGRRANISSSDVIDFKNITDENTQQYITTTNFDPKGINLLSINRLINYNLQYGQYGAKLGSIGQTLSDNDIKVTALGNADIGTEADELNRNIGLFAMDNNGQINFGNVDDINLIDNSMPFSIRTNYEKLITETKKYYLESDVIFIELGDTYRLDLYKDFLNEKSYNDMKNAITSNINSYLSQVFDLTNANDKIYVISAFPSNLDYQNKKRLSPILKFDGDGKGLLYSPSTKRDGIVSNTDVGADIINTYVLKNDHMIGKSFDYIVDDNNIDNLNNEYEKIVSIASIRSTIITLFVSMLTATWILSVILLVFNNSISNNISKTINTVFKEILKLGMIIPLSLLISPVFKFTTPGLIVLGIVLSTLVIYLLGYFLFRQNDFAQMIFYACLVLFIIVIDCAIGTPLMKNGVLSYDAIVGARYYGMGNEYQGIVIGASIFTFTSLLTLKKLPTWSIPVLSIIVLMTTASPSMGANVGASISEFVAFFTLLLLIYNVKIDFKKILLIGVGVIGVIALFIIIDMVSGSDSHLSLFVKQILENGPSAIIETFTRKISMNIKLAGTSIWVNLLIITLAITTLLSFIPNRYFTNIKTKYPLVFKGFISSLVGCIITLLVNDSGIVSAATATIYIIVPVLILTTNLIISERD